MKHQITRTQRRINELEKRISRIQEKKAQFEGFKAELEKSLIREITGSTVSGSLTEKDKNSQAKAPLEVQAVDG